MGYPTGPPVSRRVKKEYKQTVAVDLYLQGYSQQEIEEELRKRGYPSSRPAVSTYISETRNEWRQKRMEDMDIILERELAKLDQMEKDAAELFGKFNPNGQGEDSTLDEPFDCSKEANEWIKTRLKIMEQRHKLLGLYKPVKVDVESKNVNINADPEQIAATRSEILRRLSTNFE
jgi:predicted transcriptional regulator